MKQIAELLTVFNRKEKTLLCLKNLYQQTLPNEYRIDIYLTNDGCTDGTPEAVKEQYPQVNIINAQGNLYWNRGMHLAWQTATQTKDYDYYLWINDDTFIYEKAIENLLSASAIHKEKAIITGACEDTKTHSYITYGGRKNWQMVIPNGEEAVVDCINGNIVLVPQYVFHILGNLDYYFTHSKGDFDYGMRAVKAGIEMYQVGIPLGSCDAHEKLDKWCDPEVPFIQRWKMLHRPNGMPPKETFYLENRHFGFFTALKHFFSIYLRVFYPKFWIK